MSKGKKLLKETQDFLLSVINSAPYAIISIDSDGIITITNRQVSNILNLTINADELIGKHILDVIYELDELKKQVKDWLGSKLTEFDIQEVFYQGKYLTVKGRKYDGGILITIADITAQKAAEYGTLNSLLEGQEQERKRLAREIHDGIGPTLSTIKMTLANIEGDLGDLNSDVLTKFRKSYELIDEAANDLRAISHNLMPKVLSDFGLVAALETLCEKINDTRKVTVEFINTGFDGRLNKITELGLYRIGQELINNTLKHANASKITLQLIHHEDYVRLMYEDNGKGFSPKNVSKGIGLANIEYRAKALECDTVIESQPGKGMIATIETPLIKKI